ncbi:protein MAIN-LIKE 2-like [Actinidia eriantha]|uniref:protein MAIN-LIKE 2-like n=1 Tax=Actinidia eriantha TaxID=165200 RepID=UPI00258556EA|nr:protein MAIN-LIKE 2-like [Actinidia eriantha]
MIVDYAIVDVRIYASVDYAIIYVWVDMVVLEEVHHLVLEVHYRTCITLLQGGDLVIVRQPHRVYDLDERVCPYVISFGFYEISRIRGINIDHGLISVLLERWRHETHTFYLRVEDMAPTLQNIAMLTDLPIDGAPVIGPDGSFDPNKLCLRLLGKEPPRIAYRGDSLKLTWLESEFQTLQMRRQRIN